MATNDDNNEVYHNLTEYSRKDATPPAKFTLYLLLCCVTAAAASFIFGFNIGATNLPTPLIKEFYAQKYSAEYFAKENGYATALKGVQSEEKRIEDILSGVNEEVNSAVKKILDEQKNLTKEAHVEKLKADVNVTNVKLNETRKKLDVAREDVKNFNIGLWTITTALFVVGGMIGAFTSKYVCDYFGRKKGILFHHIFTIIGAVLVFIAPLVNSPECMFISRFVYGIQGGMSCGLIPTYLSEISPADLRGATGVVHQLGITVGILVSQTLGFRQLLGTASLWHYLLAIPIIPGILGVVVLLLFFPESPRALLINNRDEESARKALHRLRNSTNVDAELDQIRQESRETKSDEAISIKDLFTLSELRWPLITGLILQLTQQLCGINAIFFYSESIFKDAKIPSEHIQYAVFATGFINVIMTLVCIPLIDKLGRKPLLVYPMIIIVLDFILLTIFLTLNKDGSSMTFSYLSIACIIIFIMCFAVGLGPIPFVYVAECFRQEARSTALAICMFTNWVANLILTLTFPYLAKLCGTYVFVVFTIIVAIAVVVIFKKVPETKGRSVDQIMAFFSGKKPFNDESSGKLMPNTKV